MLAGTTANYTSGDVAINTQNGNGAKLYVSATGTAATYAIYGASTGLAGTGVYGTNPDSGVGVAGISTNSTGGTGVYGSAASGYGVYGKITGTTGYAVYGDASASGNKGTAVYGHATSAGTGVYGDSVSGYGVYGYITGTTGYAGYFSGGSGVYIGGTSGTSLTISGASSTGLNIQGHIMPSADNTYDLGGISNRMRTIYAGNGTIQTSDAREKKDIVDSDLGLELIQKLRPVSFYWKKGGTDQHYGLIAQEAEKALLETLKKAPDSDVPIISHDGKHEHYGIAYSELIGPVIKAIQELYAQVMSKFAHQEARLDAMATENTDLRKENAELKKEQAALNQRLKNLEKTRDH